MFLKLLNKSRRGNCKCLKSFKAGNCFNYSDIFYNCGGRKIGSAHFKYIALNLWFAARYLKFVTRFQKLTPQNFQIENLPNLQESRKNFKDILWSEKLFMNEIKT